jgi:hypothetical protein
MSRAARPVSTVSPDEAAALHDLALRAGMPRPWRVKALRSDGQVVPSSRRR